MHLEPKYNEFQEDHSKQVINNDRMLYSCEICTKSFSSKSDLTLHETVHNIDMQFFACEKCNMFFTTNGHLTAHKIVHTEKVVFICGGCEESFSNRDNFNLHKISCIDNSILYTPDKISIKS